MDTVFKSTYVEFKTRSRLNLRGGGIEVRPVMELHALSQGQRESRIVRIILPGGREPWDYRPFPRGSISEELFKSGLSV